MNCDSDTPTYAVVQNDPEAMIKALGSMTSLLRNGMLKVESGGIIVIEHEPRDGGSRRMVEVKSDLVLIYK